MICPKCNKCYFKQAYFNKHIEKNNCVKIIPRKEKDPIISEETTDDDIEIAIKRVTDSMITNKKSNNILEKGMEEIINKAIKTNNDDQIFKSQIDILNIEINLLKERISLLEKMEYKNDKNIKNVSETSLVLYEVNKIKPVKKEKIIINDSIVKEHLSSRNILVDAELLNKYYFENVLKENICIKKNKNNEYVFWNGEEWLNDNGNNLKHILCFNLKKLYTKINTVEQFTNNSDYLSNQEHINTLSQKKYQQHLYNIFLEKYCV